MGAGKRAHAVAAAALWTALAVLILYTGSLVPTGRWGVAALAGLMPAGAVMSGGGLLAGLLCWIGSALLSFFLVSDKLLALLFGLLFGLYPLVKNVLERMGKRWLEYPLKLLFFNVVLSVIWLSMQAAVLASLPDLFHGVSVLYVCGNMLFLLYDYGFSKLISLYMSRVVRRSRH